MVEERDEQYHLCIYREESGDCSTRRIWRDSIEIAGAGECGMLDGYDHQIQDSELLMADHCAKAFEAVRRCTELPDHRRVSRYKIGSNVFHGSWLSAVESWSKRIINDVSDM